MENKSTVFKEELNQFLNDLDDHSIFKNDFFWLLQNKDWSRQTYELIRANFFYRTELTVKGIAHVCARAAGNNDMDTLILFAYILNEETGNGERKHCHEFFMEQAFNLYGASELNVSPLLVQQAKKSDLLIAETQIYRDCIHELITDSYSRMLGVALALELHADRMLSIFREAFRRNRRKMNEIDFEHKVEMYFNNHLDNGVEERHAADARRCAMHNCVSRENLDEIKVGAKEALAVQNVMWAGMHRNCVQLDMGA
jgi:hypothetical protein